MKRFSIILLTILLVMTMFVSCSVEVNEPETNLMSLRFRTDDDASKALTASRDSFNAGDYVWYYEAKKSDTDTPATGTTTEITKVGTNGNLSELVGPFSLGKWNFTLYGYVSGTTTPSDTALVYKGSVTDYTLTATTETIEVTVEPQKTTSGTGTLKVQKSIGFTANDNTYTATNITVINVDGTGSYAAISDGTTGYDASYDTFSLKVGSYKVTVAYIKDSVTYATNTIYVNVWNGLTTTISGSLDEITVYERFNATENEDGSLEQAVSINTTSSDTPTATNYVFNYSPASTNLSTIVKGTFTKTEGTTGDATLTVTTYDISSANSNSDFVVTSSTTESPVAGIDLTLTNAEFYTDSVAIITTTIAKGLTEPNLYHKTSDSTTTMTQVDSADAVVSNGQWYYNSTDGTLVFATSSFSSFFMSSTNEAVNTTTNTAFETLNSIKADAGETVVLLKDVDLSGKDWTPIGEGIRSGSGVDATSTNSAFKGTFDGKGKIISNLKINTEGKNWNENYCIGLFGVVDGGIIKNLTLNNVSITATGSSTVGAVVGLAINDSTIENVTVRGAISAKEAGGIVGRMTISGTIRNCTNEATVNTTASAAGIVSKAYYSELNKEINIINCTNTGSITVTSGGFAGGIAGILAGNASECVNTGAVSSTAGNSGGIAGELDNYGKVSKCENTGDISSSSTDDKSYGVGGIVGWSKYNAASKGYRRTEIIEITDNTNSGAVSGPSITGVGGIVGMVNDVAKVNGNTNKANKIEGKTWVSHIVGGHQIEGILRGKTSENEIKNNNSNTQDTNVTATATDGIKGAVVCLYNNRKATIETVTKINGNIPNTDDRVEYTITYDGESIRGASLKTPDGYVSSWVGAYGLLQTGSTNVDLPILEMSGYKFKGWAESANATEAPYAPEYKVNNWECTMTVNSDQGKNVILYAVWTAN